MITITGQLVGIKEKTDNNGVGNGKYKVGVSVPKMDGFDGEVHTHVLSVSAKLAQTNILQTLNEFKGQKVSLPINPQVWQQGERSGMWIELLGPPLAKAQPAK